MNLAAVAAVVKALREHPVLEPAQLEVVRRTLQVRFPEPEALAQELVRRGWLTRYQADQIVQGRVADLALGSYVLLEPLGEGGMGQVFKARQRKLGRTDAVKVVRAERLGSPDALQRFGREVRAAAALSHPNVVHAFDAGVDGGRHYFAMELLPGCDLSHLVKDKGPLPFAKACELIRQAALGLQHAHERGLVHRDVKPSNLWLTPQGVVKVLDLGLARLTRHSDGTEGTLTADGAVMGTPDYIAPEQARQSHTVDARADLYSLGCTLYYLLAGRPPFAVGPLAAKLAAHLFDEPPALQEVRPGTPPSVAAVVRKLTAKKPEDRYQTAAEAAAALTRVRAELAAGAEAPTVEGAVAAAPLAAKLEAPTVVGRQRTPRKGGRTWLNGAIVGLLVTGMAGLAWALMSVLAPRGQEQPSGSATFIFESADATLRLTLRSKGKADAEVEAEPGKPLSLEGGDYDLQLPSDAPAGLKLSAKELSLRPGGRQSVRVEGVPLSPWALVSRPAALDGVRSWTITTRLGRGLVDHLAYSPDGRWLAVGHSDGVVRLLDPVTGRLDRVLIGSGGVIRALSWSRDKAHPRLAIAANWGTVSVWDAAAGRLLLSVPMHVETLALSPDGRTLAAAVDNDVQYWDVASGKQVNTYNGHEAAVRALAWSADGHTLATAGDGRTIRLWRPGSTADAPGLADVQNRLHNKPVHVLAWSADGQTLASGSEDGVILLWPDTGKGAPTTIAAAAGLQDLAWSPDGASLASVSQSWGPALQLWDARSGKPGLPITSGNPCDGQRAVAWSPDGKTVASCNYVVWENKYRGAVRFWDPAKGVVRHSADSYTDFPSSLRWAPDGKTIATDGDAHGVFLWDAASGDLKRSLGPLPVKSKVGPMDWSPGADRMLAVWEGQLHRWNLAAGSVSDFPKGDAAPSRITWSPRDPVVAAAVGNSVQLWDTEAGVVKTTLEGHVKPINSLVWSRDGTALASGSDDGVILVREAADLTKYRILSQPGKVTHLAWSPDGKTLAACGEDGTTRLWPRRGPDGAAPSAVLRGNEKANRWGDWLSDGKTLLTLGPDLSMRYWDAASGEPKGVMHDGPPPGGAFSPDADRLAQGGPPWTLRLTETATGRPLGTVLLLEPWPGWVVLSADGHYRFDKPGKEDALVYVVQTDDGQRTFSPAEFAEKYGWKNDPEKARLDPR